MTIQTDSGQYCEKCGRIYPAEYTHAVRMVIS
jgi:hypothetical protein